MACVHSETLRTRSDLRARAIATDASCALQDTPNQELNLLAPCHSLPAQSCSFRLIVQALPEGVLCHRAPDSASPRRMCAAALRPSRRSPSCLAGPSAATWIPTTSTRTMRYGQRLSASTSRRGPLTEPQMTCRTHAAESLQAHSLRRKPGLCQQLWLIRPSINLRCSWTERRCNP